jgi:hydrogenase assembly chaperone HypC/HupF
MCLGIPGQVVEVLAEHEGQRGLVDVQGARRRIDLSLLDLDRESLKPSDWVLIHMGFALERVDEEAAAEALAGLELMGRPEP